MHSFFKKWYALVLQFSHSKTLNGNKNSASVDSISLDTEHSFQLPSEPQDFMNISDLFFTCFTFVASLKTLCSKLEKKQSNKTGASIIQKFVYFFIYFIFKPIFWDLGFDIFCLNSCSWQY